jgi:DNA primase
LYLGQLLSGEEAANNLGQGIELLAAQAAEVAQDPHGNPDELTAINREIADAFCSLAEVYLTDLWYECPVHFSPAGAGEI